MVETGADGSRAGELLLGSVLGAVVIVDGALGFARTPSVVAAETTASGSAPGSGLLLRMFQALPISPNALGWMLAGLVLVAVAVATVRVGLRSRAGVAVALSGTLVAAVYALTGLILPWDQVSYWLARGLVDAVAAVPLAGRTLARLAFGDVTVGQELYVRAYLLHYGIVLALAGLAVLALAPPRYRRAAVEWVRGRR